MKAQRAPHDARQSLLSLSAAGRRAFAPLEKRSQEQAATLLNTLPAPQQQEVVGAARRIETLLAETAPQPAELRPLASGDLGWVVSRHGALYAQEYGWDLRFEAKVARIAADYVDQLDIARESAWVAESAGTRLGCVFLVQARDENSGAVEPGVAQLRMLLVEPAARGQGLGKRLTAVCEGFARAKGYTRIRLWTHSRLPAAGQRAAPRLRPGPGERDLGEGAGVMNAACPCGSGAPYAACCGRWHAGPLHLQAPDAPALMRSRYSAFVLGLEDYLRDTWHASTRPAAPLQLDLAVRWLGLEVRRSAVQDATHATVEFVARSKQGGRATRLHEVSRFVLEDGRWYYVDGDLH